MSGATAAAVDVKTSATPAAAATPSPAAAGAASTTTAAPAAAVAATPDYSEAVAASVRAAEAMLQTTSSLSSSSVSRDAAADADPTGASAVSKSLLSDKAIVAHMTRGTIVISPFVPAHLSTSSYDVTLGRFYFRERLPEPGLSIYNPYSAAHVARVWGAVQTAERAADYSARTGVHLDNIAADDALIWIAPGETILAHTNEFVGGRHTVTTMMKARSSMGRNFIEVCKCAGWGDIGYVNRWTMEVTNNSRYYSIPLVVGRRIAQIVFFDSDGTLHARSYASTSGKYQTTDDVAAVMANWTPLSCLPRMYADREVRDGPVRDPLRHVTAAASEPASAVVAGADTRAAAAAADKKETVKPVAGAPL